MSPCSQLSSVVLGLVTVVGALTLSSVDALAQTQPLTGQPGAPPMTQPGVPPTGQPGQFQSQPAQPQPNPWGSMGSGGIAPPPPLQNGQPNPPNGQPPNTGFDQNLDKSKDKDSGRGLSWFWVDAYGGFEHLGLQSFNTGAKELSAGLIETTGSGGVIGAGIGAQIFFFTIGVRGRMGFFKPWQVGRVGPEVGFRFPLGRFEPHVEVGGGYAALANFDPTVPSAVAIKGGYARASAGLDVYPVKVLSLGAEASFDFLGLSRSALTPAEIVTARSQNTSITDAQSALLATKGSGFGASFALVGVIGVHL